MSQRWAEHSETEYEVQSRVERDLARERYATLCSLLDSKGWSEFAKPFMEDFTATVKQRLLDVNNANPDQDVMRGMARAYEALMTALTSTRDSLARDAGLLSDTDDDENIATRRFER